MLDDPDEPPVVDDDDDDEEEEDEEKEVDDPVPAEDVEPTRRITPSLISFPALVCASTQ